MKLHLILVLCISFLTVSGQSNKSTCETGDCIQGYGVKTYRDGGYEKGEWKNGKLNGKGAQFFGKTSNFDGDTYVGEFRKGLYHGQGVYSDISEGISHKGEWKNGAPVADKMTKVDKNKKTAVILNKLEWKIIESENYGFQIKFPLIKGTNVEEVESIEEDTEFGDIKKTSINLNCQKTGHPNLAYSLIVLEIGVENFLNYSGTDYKNYFKEVESTLEEMTNCKSIMKTVIDSEDFKGREILFKNIQYGLRIKTRIILFKGFEYRITVMMLDKEYLNPYVNQFMDSFKFN